MPANPKSVGLLRAQSIAPLDFAGARRRFLEALLGDKKRCEHCGSYEGVSLESSRTAYPFDGAFDSPENPNRSLHLCPTCAVEHHAHWDATWSDYHASQLRGA